MIYEILRSLNAQNDRNLAEKHVLHNLLPPFNPLTDIHSIHIKDNFYIAGNIKHLLDLFNLGLLDYPYIVF